MEDNVNHPKHYNSHPSGIEAITIVEHLSFNIGNAIKYLWRADHKGAQLDDLRKAAWYINREIKRLSHDTKGVQTNSTSVKSGTTINTNEGILLTTSGPAY